MTYQYNLQQWMMFFFIYCLFGWIWESCYVSAKKRHWVNRGFLHGPLLPIYGSGAIAVLFLTLPVQDNLVAVYFVGTIGATVLEYITGAVMERMFHVKYWDYSNQPCNLNGYICLSSSIAWGFFSIGLVRYIHRPLADLVLKIPNIWMIGIDSVVFVGFCVDLVISAREAFDLKAIIMAEKEKDLQLIQRSLAVVADSIEESSQKLRENLEESSQKLRDGIQNKKLEEQEKLLLLKSELEQRKDVLTKYSERKYENAKRILKRNPGSTFQKKKLSLEEISKFFERYEH